MLEGNTATPVVAIYARVSTEEQHEGRTIDAQICELERFAKAGGWVVANVYKDDGWSGSLMARPALDQLRDDARHSQFDTVLVNDVDRLARDVVHLGVIKRDLEKQHVRLVIRKLPIDSSPVSNLMLNILGSFAEFERELIIDRTRRGRRHKVEQRKEYLGSNTAYGYQYRPMDRVQGKPGILQVNVREASVVRAMFDWVAKEGLSANAVARRLNDRKMPAQKSTTWAKSSVLSVLRNEMYAGLWHYNKHQCCEPKAYRTKKPYRSRVKSSIRTRPREEWIPLELPASLQLVPRDVWEQAQLRLKQNIAFSPRNEKHPYLLKGLVECGGCGARFVGDSWHGRFYYRCSRRCKLVPAIREHRLEELVVEAQRSRSKAGNVTRRRLQEQLRTSAVLIIFYGARVMFRDPEHDSTFPDLQKTDDLVGCRRQVNKPQLPS